MVSSSLPSRGAWIEIVSVIWTMSPVLWSLPSRGAWIEITPDGGKKIRPPVAPLTGSVD